MHADDNPTGVLQAVFDGTTEAATDDRYAYSTQFYKDFYNLEETLGSRISEGAVRNSWNVAAGTSRFASSAAVATWHEDFRADIAKIDVPTLILQGTEDRILPIDSCGRPFAKAVPQVRFVEIDGAPNGLLWTHAEEVNKALMGFRHRIAPSAPAGAPATSRGRTLWSASSMFRGEAVVDPRPR